MKDTNNPSRAANLQPSRSFGGHKRSFAGPKSTTIFYFENTNDPSRAPDLQPSFSFEGHKRSFAGTRSTTIPFLWRTHTILHGPKPFCRRLRTQTIRRGPQIYNHPVLLKDTNDPSRAPGLQPSRYFERHKRSLIGPRSTTIPFCWRTQTIFGGPEMKHTF